MKALKEALERFRNEVNLQSSRLAAERKLYIESTGSILKTDDPNEFITSSDANKLKAYKNEIKQTRQQRDIEMKMKKNLIEKIVATWKDLKDIRAKQQFRNTDLKLIIKKYVFLLVLEFGQFKTSVINYLNLFNYTVKLNQNKINFFCFKESVSISMILEFF